MNVGFMGLGKLGLPCALEIERNGHSVVGFDPSEKVKQTLQTRMLPYKEVGVQELLEQTKIQIRPLKDVVSHSEIVFVPVQTPHLPKYEGVTRLPETREDFDYSYLTVALSDLSQEALEQKKELIVIIISTVLPGTIEREIRPILNEYIKLCYNPFFIAMGTTIPDFKNPEFVLFGVDDTVAAQKARELYHTIHNRPFFETTIENAELIKVLYNTYISSKISIANTILEICHKTPNTNADDVVTALGMATERLISTRYMSPGMGDGGGCHPRDNIALSWLSKKLDLSYDWFENIMVCREKQTEWLADLVVQYASQMAYSDLPVVILGAAFKPETNLTVGSPAMLLYNLLMEKLPNHRLYIVDPIVQIEKEEDKNLSIDDLVNRYVRHKGVYFIGTKHDIFSKVQFPNGSLVVDPWRYIPDQRGIRVIRIGE